MSILDLLKKLADTGHQCVFCGREAPEGELCCADCAAEEERLRPEDPRAGGVWHVYRFEGVIRGVVHKLKYGDLPRYAFFIAQKMSEFAAEHGIAADLAAFVPVHKKRRKQRGFDQCELIAGHLSVLMELPCAPLLERVRDTKPQYDLGPKERFANVRGAFALSKREYDLEGKTVLLVDDIYTTGATMGECAKLLAEAGAAVVPFAFCKEY